MCTLSRHFLIVCVQTIRYLATASLLFYSLNRIVGIIHHHPWCLFFFSDAIEFCSLENNVLTIHTPHHKKDEWKLQNADSDSNPSDAAARDVNHSASASFISELKARQSTGASDTVAPDVENSTSTPLNSALKSRGSADVASTSLGLKDTESIRLLAKAVSSFQSTESSSQVLSAFLSSSRTQSTTVKRETSINDRIKNFVKRETSHLQLNHKLREAELKSYREDMVFQRRLMLVLAYAMASVFTALSLWVVCSILCDTVLGLNQNRTCRVMPYQCIYLYLLLSLWVVCSILCDTMFGLNQNRTCDFDRLVCYRL